MIAEIPGVTRPRQTLSEGLVKLSFQLLPKTIMGANFRCVEGHWRCLSWVRLPCARPKTSLKSEKAGLFSENVALALDKQTFQGLLLRA